MPQILKGLSYTDYCKIPALRFSDAKEFRKTPLHARHAILNPREDTASTILGTAFHTLLLEPEKFSQYVVAPKVDKRTKEGKLTWAEFEANNPNAICLSQQEHDALVGMNDSALAHPLVQSLIARPSLREVVITWNETVRRGEETVIQPCKARIDWVVKDKQTFVIDVKTTRDASAEEFMRSISKYAYHAQAASYLRAVNAAAPITGSRRFIWLVVENVAPYGCAVYEASEGMLQQGEGDYYSWVQQYVESTQTGFWPGYPSAVLQIDLPKWAQRELE